MPSAKGGEAGELFVLGRSIARVRTDAGLTQDELAKAVGISRLSVSFYEQGLRTPAIMDLIRIARATRSSLADITGPLEHIRPPPRKPREARNTAYYAQKRAKDAAESRKK